MERIRPELAKLTREQLSAKLKTFPADRAANRPTKVSIEGEEFDAAEVLAYKRLHERKMAAAVAGIDQERQYNYATQEGLADLRRAQQALPDYVAQVARLAAEVENRQRAGTGMYTHSQFPGGEALSIAKKRTHADELASERARRALTQVEALADIATTKDFRAKVDAIWDALFAADKAARWEATPIAPPPPEPVNGGLTAADVQAAQEVCLE